MAEEAPKSVGTGPALGKDFGEHVMDVGKKHGRAFRSGGGLQTAPEFIPRNADTS